MSPDPHAEHLASSSVLPSVTQTDTPKLKPPVGAIAGGRSPVPQPTLPVARDKCCLFVPRLLGAIGGFVVLCILGFGLCFLRKQGGIRIPRIRKASGPMSLFDPQEGKPNLGLEEAVAVRRPLLYVRDFLFFSFQRF